jgi:RNA polymerase sigma factor (sigma-70 family)
MPSKQYLLHKKKDVKDMHNPELLQACQHDSELLGEFLQQNKDFIFSMIIHFKGNVEELCAKFKVSEEELRQHAYIGVISALREFDFNRGIKFTTFVVRPMLWEINQFLYSNSQSVRLSRGAVDLIKRMIEIENMLGYRPNEEKMAQLLQVSVERYREIARFSNEIEYYDGIDNFDIGDTSERYVEEEVTNKVYVQQLLQDPMFTDFEKSVMRLVMEETNNAQIAERLGVYPMTINRTLSRIRNKVENHDQNIKNEEKQRAASKYEEEIRIIEQETKERNELMGIEDIAELLDVCGFDISQYTTRILYYIRQKANQKLAV